MKKAPFIYLIAFAFCLWVVFCGFIYFRINAIEKQVKSLPVINKPISFAREFDPNSYHQVSLPLLISKDFIYGRTEYNYASPYSLFPPSLLNVIDTNALSVTPCNSDYVKRVIYMDIHWKVFWIVLRDCDERMPGKVFGPFKTTLPIQSIYDIESYDK